MSLVEINARVGKALMKSGRADSDATLIAISKKQPIERVTAVLGAGHRVFGENYVQEARERWTPLQETYRDLQLHLVGPLQSNKAEQAFGLFHTIHSVDRPSLTKKLARLAQKHGFCPNLFVQVNTGAEPQKSGVTISELDGFLDDCRVLDLKVVGLMCIPPAKEEAQSHFSCLAKLARENGFRKLSMGMSSDFEKAIAHGATHIRVGSAIFGERPLKSAMT